jgi:hypothetical protein
MTITATKKTSTSNNNNNNNNNKITSTLEYLSHDFAILLKHPGSAPPARVGYLKMATGRVLLFFPLLATTTPPQTSWTSHLGFALRKESHSKDLSILSPSLYFKGPGRH